MIKKSTCFEATDIFIIQYVIDSMLFNEKNIHTQTIFLTLQGSLISSCNTLFDSQSLAPYPASQGLPLLDSILETFQKKKVTKIHLPRVETNYPNLPGFYDFTFELLRKKDEYIIRWVIYDLTSTYKSLQDKQQRSHEDDISNC